MFLDMRKYNYFWILFLLISISLGRLHASNVFIEAENFTNKGGWVIDQQFMGQMGSSYLMAHGMGIPVADASTVIKFPKTGHYHVYVRTFNWTAPWISSEGPGKFMLSTAISQNSDVLGSKGNKWFWQYAGTMQVIKRKTEVKLKDLTGFNGRCDAIYFTQEKSDVPPEDAQQLADFRKKKLKLSHLPRNAGKYDFVVVGGGVAGVTAAITAARQGLKVALIQDRPVLGGNNSSEVRVHLGGRINLPPYPNLGAVVNEIGPTRKGNAQPADHYEDNKKLQMVKAEKNISLFLNHRVYAIEKKGNKIDKVFVKNIENAKELSLSALLFADCTGDGTIGYLAGASFMMGSEGKDEFNEPSAPEKATDLIMGSSVQWYSKEGKNTSKFPDFEYGIKFNEENSLKLKKGEWNWETGLNLDQITDFEKIRDYGLLVVFSNWSFLKNNSIQKDQFKYSSLDWVAYVAGKRESRRLIGDFVLKEQDILNAVNYPDASVTTSWSIDLHYPDPKNSKYFPNQEFKTIAVQKIIRPYPIPYRCFYSRDIDNLFMAGRNISVTHIALGTVRVMRTTGMMGEVVGMAASIAKKNKTTPRGVYETYLDQLKSLMSKGAGKYQIENVQNYNLGEVGDE